MNTFRIGLIMAAVTALASTVALGLSPGHAEGAVPDCAGGAPNLRTWIGPAAGSWGTAGNWSNDGSQPPTPGADEIACIGNVNVTLDVAANVDAVVSGPNGTLTMPNGHVLTLSPPASEESQVANLVGGRVALAGAGDMTVTKTFDTRGVLTANLGGAAGSKLTLPASVGTSANVGSLSLDRRTLVVSDGVTVTQSAGASVSSNNGGSIENSGVWNATGDGSVFSPGTASGIFHNAATGVVRKTGGTSTSTTLNPFDNDGLIENQTSGQINLEGGSSSSSDGRILTGPGRIVFNIGTYAIAGEVSGNGTVHVNGTATFSGSYAVMRTETGGGGSRIVFDTPSPQTLPQLVIGQTVAGSADLVVTERFDCNGCRLEGAAGSKLTLAAAVGTNATAPSVQLNGRTLVVEDGVTVAHSGITNGTEGGSVHNRGTWNTTGTFDLPASSVFRNTDTGVLRRTAAAGDGTTQVGPTVVNDGLIENLSTGTLSIGPFAMNAPGKIGVLSTSASPALSGSGRLSPDVVQGQSIVSPGSSAGTIEVIGAPGGWEMRPDAKLQVEIGGTAAGQFDKLLLAGPFTVATDRTTLALSTLPGYTPAAGDQFAIVEVAEPSSVSGTFATVTGTDLGGGLRFQVVYEARRVLVRVLSSTSQPPNAVDDSATVAEDSAANAINVLANDTDPNGDALTVASNTQPANGSASCNASSCSYTPVANFSGNDSFTYRAEDPSGSSDVATVNVTVSPVNDAPDALDDSATVPQDAGPTAIDVLTNDTAAPDSGETLTVAAVTQGSNGSVAITAAGSGLTYAPDAGFSGADSFTYTISDGNGGSDTATVNVTVTRANEPPDAVDDNGNVAEDSGANAIAVLANDADPNGDALSISAVTQGANGSVAITGGGSGLSYTPNANFNGSDSFTYTVSDGNGGSDTATVTLTVDPVNDPPDAVDDDANVAEDSGANAVAVLANDGDPDGDALSISAVTQGANGSVAISGGGSGLTYTPNAGFNGDDSFTYTISDGNGGSDTAAVRIAVRAVNDAPNAVDDAASVPQDAGPTAIAVLANDSDPDGDPLSITLVGQGAHGAVAITSGGSGLTYDPAQGYAGPDLFTYTISDGRGGSATASVAVTVLPGREILFTRFGGGARIFGMNADGSGQSPLPTPAGSAVFGPAWSPDRAMIAFVDGTAGPRRGIWVMNTNGSGLRQLTAAPDVDPAWSPDGTRIAFYRSGSGIWVINADGSSPRRLTRDGVLEWRPSWSPDSTRLVFRRGNFSVSGNFGDIYVMNADGSGRVRLLSDPGIDDMPDWSPDGTKIAFASSRTGGGDIYVMNADGSGLTRLTSGNVAPEYEPSWSPDGLRIAYTRVRFGAGAAIYVMNADGSGQTRLTNDLVYNAEPDW